MQIDNASCCIKLCHINFILFQFLIRLLEKKYQDQIRLLEMDFSREKESLMIQTCHLRQDIDKQINTIQEQLTKFRLAVKMLEKVSAKLTGIYFCYQ